MTDVALALPLSAEQWLLADAPRHGHRVVVRCSGADELADALTSMAKAGGGHAGGAELVLAAAAPQYLSARVVAVCDALGLRLLVVAGSAQERRYAASVGVVDPVEAPFDWAMLTGAARPAPTEIDEDTSVRFVRPAPEAEPVRRGSVIAVWGPDGAPGRTSIAIALAAELAEAGLRVALADADTRAAAVAPALGLLDEAPGFAAACRLAGGGVLDRLQFERIAQLHRNHGTGRGELQVLTGIGRPSRWPELTADRIAGVLSAARDWVDVTVVDVAPSFELDEELMSDLHAPRRNAATIEVLRSADRVVAIGAADPVGLSRFIRAHGELLELVDPDRVTTVVNKLRSGAIGLDAASQVRQTLARFGGIDDPVLIPWDVASFDAALLSGRPLCEVAPRSAARVAIRGLAGGLSALLRRMPSRATA